MERAGHRVVAEHGDHPFDLAPPTEVDEVSYCPTAMGAARRLGERKVAEAVDQVGRIGEGFPTGEMDVVTQAFPRSLSWRSDKPRPFQSAQRRGLTPDKRGGLCHGGGMSAGRYTQAGGFVLALSILVGTAAGAMLRQPSIGFLVGAGLGLALAVLIWALDRRRPR